MKWLAHLYQRSPVAMGLAGVCSVVVSLAILLMIFTDVSDGVYTVAERDDYQVVAGIEPAEIRISHEDDAGPCETFSHHYHVLATKEGQLYVVDVCFDSDLSGKTVVNKRIPFTFG